MGNETVRPLKNRFAEVANFTTLLSQHDVRKLRIVSILQVVLSILDLIGVALIGIIGALAVTGVRSQEATGGVAEVLGFFKLTALSFQTQTVILALIAVSFLLLRTALSIIITRRTLFFLSRRSAEIASKLISQVMAQPLSTLNQFSTQRIQYTLTTGTNALAIGVFGSIVSVIADGALLFVLGVGLLIIDPTAAIVTLLIFGGIIAYLYLITNRRTRRISKQYSELRIQDSEILLELLSSYRELFIRNRRGFFVDQAKKIKWQVAEYSAELAWLPYISKYAVEIAFTLGTMTLAALQFATNDSTAAVGSLSLFLAAGTRIVPALLRLQQNLVTITGNIEQARPTVDLFLKTNPSLQLPQHGLDVDTFHPGFVAEILLEDVSFRFPEANTDTLSLINLRIKPGETLAIVGPSGAGKSTLVDLILGIYPPSHGTISIGGLEPAESIVRWPGSLGYVPQEVVLMSGSIATNVSAGFAFSDQTEQLVTEALKIAQLEQFIDNLPDGADTKVGERGKNLSGGQRQRVGIARAMFTKPGLLVLDEATSSLDGQTDLEISEAIQGLKGKVTLILVAHRLSTVKNADRIVYLEAGKVVAQGTFDEVRKTVPDFNNQAQLMGL
jgi:ABC-type multidrug transport system fused ATPase/permease subunit